MSATTSEQTGLKRQLSAELVPSTKEEYIQIIKDKYETTDAVEHVTYKIDDADNPFVFKSKVNKTSRVLHFPLIVPDITARKIDWDKMLSSDYAQKLTANFCFCNSIWHTEANQTCLSHHTTCMSARAELEDLGIEKFYYQVLSNNKSTKRRKLDLVASNAPRTTLHYLKEIQGITFKNSVRLVKQTSLQEAMQTYFFLVASHFLNMQQTLPFLGYIAEDVTYGIEQTYIHASDALLPEFFSGSVMKIFAPKRIERDETVLGRLDTIEMSAVEMPIDSICFLSTNVTASRLRASKSNVTLFKGIMLAMGGNETMFENNQDMCWMFARSPLTPTFSHEIETVASVLLGEKITFETIEPLDITPCTVEMNSFNIHVAPAICKITVELEDNSLVVSAARWLAKLATNQARLSNVTVECDNGIEIKAIVNGLTADQVKILSSDMNIPFNVLVTE